MWFMGSLDKIGQEQEVEALSSSPDLRNFHAHNKISCYKKLSR